MTIWTDPIVGARFKTFIVADHYGRARKLANQRKIGSHSWIYVHSRGWAAPFNEAGIQPERIIVYYMGEMSASVQDRVERFISEGRILVEQVES